MTKVLPSSVVVLLALAGCTTGNTGTSLQTGGAAGTGGQTQAGGSGGGSGGSHGGTVGSGGTVTSGGTVGSGGTSTTGGTINSGGNSAGGAAGSGGKGGSGGTVASGGTMTTGGTVAGGGRQGTGGGGPGGTPVTGGTIGAGGTTVQGGSDGGPGDASTRSDGAGTGGGGGRGGAPGTGGTPGAGGGTTVPVGASGLPPAGTSGQAKPSGSGTTVTVLDWAGFKTAISFTFDDSNSSQISNYSALQALNDKGNNVRYTFYLQTGKSESSNAVWGTAHKDGHELGNHTKSHSSGASTSDIQAAEDFIKSTWGVTSYDVAAPNGDSSYQSTVSGMGKFITNRTAGNSGGIAMTDNPSSKQWALPCIIPATGASASSMQSSVTSGTSGGKWNVFLVHGFSGGSDGAYQPVAIGEFTNTVKWARDQGTMWVDTVENVASYWIGAYGFKKLKSTTSGTDQTWTWKTSDFNNPFPPGKYLRVKTDGGTLKQGSTVLQWDDHGYYEVSLDAGTLTLSAQ
jgi:hypothetical protein